MATEKPGEASPRLSPCSDTFSGSCYLGSHLCHFPHTTGTSSSSVLPLHLLLDRWVATEMHTYVKTSLVPSRMVISLCSVLSLLSVQEDTVLAGITDELLCLIDCARLTLDGPCLVLFLSLPVAKTACHPPIPTLPRFHGSRQFSRAHGHPE